MMVAPVVACEEEVIYLVVISDENFEVYNKQYN